MSLKKEASRAKGKVKNVKPKVFGRELRRGKIGEIDPKVIPGKK